MIALLGRMIVIEPSTEKNSVLKRKVHAKRSHPSRYVVSAADLVAVYGVQAIDHTGFRPSRGFSDNFDGVEPFLAVVLV